MARAVLEAEQQEFERRCQCSNSSRDAKRARQGWGAARRGNFKAKLEDLNTFLPAWSCKFVLAHGVNQKIKGQSMFECAQCNVAVSSKRRWDALRKAPVCTALPEPERSQAIAMPVRQRQFVVAGAVLENHHGEQV